MFYKKTIYAPFVESPSIVLFFETSLQHFCCCSFSVDSANNSQVLEKVKGELLHYVVALKSASGQKLRQKIIT